MTTPPVSEALSERMTTSIGAWLASLDKQEDDEEDVTAFRGYLDVLRECSEALATNAAPRDKWESFWNGSSVILRSAKLSHDFTLEVDDLRGRLCLSSSVAFSQHLPKMTDEFWREVLGLHAHADVAFVSNRRDDEGKSIAWAIMHDHVELAAIAAEDSSDKHFLDAGTLEMTWPLARGMSEICQAAAGAFRRLYRLNYMLYRHHYITSYSKRKNQ